MIDAVSISEHRLTLVLRKMALLLTFVIVVLGLAASLITKSYQSFAANAFMLCLAFFFLSYGFLSILHIIDWFEARRAKRNA